MCVCVCVSINQRQLCRCGSRRDCGGAAVPLLDTRVSLWGNKWRSLTFTVYANKISPNPQDDVSVIRPTCAALWAEIKKKEKKNGETTWIPIALYLHGEFVLSTER